ncbi:undecaprenyl-phosphate glucose phosphotransferase [Sphingomonas sp. SUN019]|uniref:undecaprenyl-phosphate glucose phosphotransferase n=1 Tax=Sphingomonas sp. SUN019 TaxID=2937788 RepID=UPI00216456E7|nr:undecaprenyl-phosphate glucose phosphotransferase [Sphingomonas sp. SUN019]UVO51487.1 undecaprenyl-phosphate glucose phosphotransferase [Sphingomonas sp. SUN019]
MTGDIVHLARRDMDDTPDERAAAAAPLPGARMAVPIGLMSIATWATDIAAIAGASLLLDTIGLTNQIDRILPIAAICYTGIAQVTGAYDFESLLYFKRAWPKVANAWLSTVLAIVALALALNPVVERSLLVMSLWFVAGATAVAVARTLLIPAVRALKRAGAFDGRTAIIGTGVQGVDLADYVAHNDDLALSLVGFFGDIPLSAEEAAALPLPYFGGIAELVAAIRAGAIDKVFLALPWSDEERLRAIVVALANTPVEIRLSPDKAGFAYARRPITSMAGLSVITLLEQPLSGMQRLQKRIEDVVLALAALLLLTPVMAIVALAIKLTSPGPVLFRQPREGFNCQSFDILKFRTMHYHLSPPSAEVVQAQRRDPRVTRVGALLRRTSIDELPQLFNVLLGHMSLVGPRPHAPSTRAGGKLFADVAATYAARHKVKPGLTGWAQVCGWRGETTTEHQLVRRLEHDMYYVDHWSIWFDLYILARTGATVLLQRSAY